LIKIVLDIDDTLYLERDYVFSGFRAVGDWLLSNYCAAGFFEIAWNYFLTGSRGDIFNKSLQDINIVDKKLVAMMVEVYRTHDPDIHLLTDALSFLQNHSSTELAIISDGYSASQGAKIRALDLEKHVGAIIVTDNWGREYWKPHSRAFETVQQGYLPARCVYIADNPLKDFIAPARLGWMPSIRIRRAESMHYDVPTPNDCIEVASLNDVKVLL
jgi:putative hydrolase of the HAD superfamily